MHAIYCTQDKHYRSSALYVRRHEQNFNVVEVDLNLDERFMDIKKLSEILRAREIDKEFNLYELVAFLL